MNFANNKIIPLKNNFKRISYRIKTYHIDNTRINFFTIEPRHMYNQGNLIFYRFYKVSCTVIKCWTVKTTVIKIQWPFESQAFSSSVADVQVLWLDKSTFTQKARPLGYLVKTIYVKYNS